MQCPGTERLAETRWEIATLIAALEQRGRGAGGTSALEEVKQGLGVEEGAWCLPG